MSEKNLEDRAKKTPLPDYVRITAFLDAYGNNIAFFVKERATGLSSASPSLFLSGAKTVDYGGATYEQCTSRAFFERLSADDDLTPSAVIPAREDTYRRIRAR